MSNETSHQTLENLGHEDRSFPPEAEFTAQANGTEDLYAKADEDYEAFWADQARSRLSWSKEFTEVLDWSKAPFATWFADGELNVAYNCVDRHVEAGNGDKVAIHFVGEPDGDTRDITYAELHEQVQKAANALQDLGVGKGDTVAIYLPMIPEAAVAMLACARIGAPHSVVFGGFSAEALYTRINDAKCKLVITSDGGYRRGSPAALKPAVDAALAKGETTVEHVLVVKRTGQDTEWNDRDVWWHEALDQAADTHEAQGMEAEHPLFILYTSGTTGKPKGIFHTTGGYLTQAAYTNSVVHDVHPETDVYWCTADIGWVTGHSYIVYGPMANGATQVMYEGTPDTPHQGRWWEIVEKYKVSILYTAPTAIRTFMKWGEAIPQKFDLSSLRVLGSVGEPINPEAWMWYRRVIGGDQAPIVDTWWQTETGAIMISPLPGVTALKPGFGPAGDPRDLGRRRRRRGQVGAGRRRRVPRRRQAVAVDAARHLGRPGALPGDVLVAVRRALLRRRRGEEGRRGQHLAPRPGRRRHERVGSPAVHDGDRVGAGLAPEGGRGRGRRGERRDDGPGGLRVRHPPQ